ncbi:MAG: ion transporter [Rhodothermales bacterium]|nr:ion transporter [Rhodothermales bacterium]
MSERIDPQYADLPGWRGRANLIIFGADTPLGKAFDVALIIVILLSVVTVMMESVVAIRTQFSGTLWTLEWVFTLLFSIEYILRLTSANRPLKYARSFFGVIDLLATIPTYVSLFVPGAQFFIVIRLLRILRVFRVLKLARFLSEADILVRALRQSRHKITLFLFTVLTLVVILGSLMYLIETPENGFTSIPKSIYWAIVTLTTVGYGDIYPQTDIGQMLASVVMIMGYGIIAVPTGIVTAEMVATGRQGGTGRHCPECDTRGHARDALFCKYCGVSMPDLTV